MRFEAGVYGVGVNWCDHQEARLARNRVKKLIRILEDDIRETGAGFGDHIVLLTVVEVCILSVHDEKSLRFIIFYHLHRLPGGSDGKEATVSAGDPA